MTFTHPSDALAEFTLSCAVLAGVSLYFSELRMLDEDT